MTMLQEQARALGDPTRHELFRHIADADGPVGVAQLTERFGLSHNTVRQHLAKLVAAGLVVEGRAAAAGPGRPRLVYVVDPAVGGAWGTAGPYERLSRMLVEVIRTGRTPVEVGRLAADQFRVSAPSGDTVADLAAAMHRQGFEPEIRDTRGGADVVLRACPFASAAGADRATVCALHLGIAQGLADDGDVEVRELVANDPLRADCLVRLRSPSGPRGGGGEAKLTLRGST